MPAETHFLRLLERTEDHALIGCAGCEWEGVVRLPTGGIEQALAILDGWREHQPQQVPTRELREVPR